MPTITRALPLIALTFLAACATPRGGVDGEAAIAPVEVGIVALNDFHGALEPPRAGILVSDGKGGSVPVPAGGGAWLASAVDAVKARHANNVVVAAGDLTSASQLSSSLYLDEPSVGVMNRLGLEFNAVGNHEFDRGWRELLRLQSGGCEKTGRREPCQRETFAGADYSYLAASTFHKDGSPLFPATGTKSFGEGAGKVTIGFVGLALKGVPSLVSPSALEGLTFGDEAEAINKAAGSLRAKGADAVVVLIHEGGKTEPGDPDSCTDLTGDIRPILDRLDPGVDLVVSGHTHWQYVCNYEAGSESAQGTSAVLLTSAGSYGRMVTDITLTIDPAANRVLAARAHNVVVQSEGYSSGRGDVPNTDVVPRFSPRADVADYIAGYVDASKDLIARPVGRLSGPAAKASGEGLAGGPLGNLIADAQLEASLDAGAQIAFTNPFGIRAPIDPGADGTVSFGQLYATQPFGNELVTMSLTGEQVRAVIEQGLDDDGPKQILAPSHGLHFTYDFARPSGERVTRLTLDGKPLDPAATYRVSVVNFLAEGGDGYTVFAKGLQRTRGMVDIDALERWIAAVPVREVPLEERAVAAD